MGRIKQDPNPRPPKMPVKKGARPASPVASVARPKRGPFSIKGE